MRPKLDSVDNSDCEQGGRIDMSQNIETVNNYLDGFRKNDHEQILSA